MNTRLSKRMVIIALFVNLAIPLGGMSTDVYLPSMPAMTDYFMSPNLLIQLTITLFTLGLGFGQFIAGPIVDSLGRRRPLIMGLLLQLLSVIAILITHSPYSLIFARLVQGLGAAFMMVPARAMLADTFEGAALKRQYIYITASFGLGPIIAPFIGGYLQHLFYWQANFLFILVYILLVLCFVLVAIPETSHDRHPLSLQQIKTRYASVLSHHFFVVSIILVSTTMGYVAIFNVVGPFVIQDILHKSAVYYGYIALFMGLAWFGGNMTNRIAGRHHWKRKTHVILPLMIINGIVMLFLSFGPIHILRFVVPVFVMTYLAGFIFPVYVAESLSLFKENAASANGLLFSLLWVIFSLFSFIGTQLKLHSVFPLACVYMVMAVLSYVWFFGMFRRYSHKEV